MGGVGGLGVLDPLFPGCYEGGDLSLGGGDRDLLCRDLLGERFVREEVCLVSLVRHRLLGVHDLTELVLVGLEGGEGRGLGKEVFEACLKADEGGLVSGGW